MAVPYHPGSFEYFFDRNDIGLWLLWGQVTSFQPIYAKAGIRETLSHYLTGDYMAQLIISNAVARG